MTDEIENHFLITLDIAGCIVALKTEEDAVAKRIFSRYRDFLSTDKPPLVEIDIKILPGARFIEPKPGPWIIEVEFDNGNLSYQSYLERAEVDFSSGYGTLEMTPEAKIENFLRTVIAWLCINNNSVLLHAAGVIRNGSGYVFFGPSGAGKTTTSRIAAKSSDVVSDDLVVIRLENGIGRLYGVPFRGELSEAPRANQNAPLQAIFRLRQDTDHYIEWISPVKAVADLVASSPFVVQELSLSNLLIEVCSKISKSVPILTLHFKRDDGFWKVIDEHFENVP